MLNNRYENLDSSFDADHMNFWSNLSRVNNLLVIMNISMFFLPSTIETLLRCYWWQPEPPWGSLPLPRFWAGSLNATTI